MNTKMKVKGKVKETTELADVDMGQKDVSSDQPPMTPDQMAAILDKAMQILDKNWLTDQMKNADDQSPSLPGWWQSDQPKDPRKVYTFSIAWWGMTQPLVAENIKQAVDYVWSGNVMSAYVEDYTPPTESQWLSHEWLGTPFYY